MDTINFLPHPALQPYVSHYVFVAVGMLNTITTVNLVPTGAAVMGVMPGARKAWMKSREEEPFVTVPGVFFTGQMTSFREVILPDRYSTFYVIFKPWGAYRLLSIGQQHCLDQNLDLIDLMPAQQKDIQHKLEDCQTPAEIRQAVEQFLLCQLKQLRYHSATDRVAYLTRQIIQQSHEPALIKKICKEEGLSKSTLERQVKEVIGLNPKQFQRIVRFNTVLQHICQQTERRHWTEVVYRFGYYDQAHFIREFKLFYGKTPSAYSSNDVLLTSIAQQMGSGSVPV